MKKSAHSLLYLLVLLLDFLVPLLQLHLIVLTLPNVDHSAQCCPRYASCYGQVWHRWFLINFFFKITTASSWWIIYLSFCPFFWRFGILVLVFTSHELKTKAKRRREWIYFKKLKCGNIVFLQYISMERNLLRWTRPGNRFERYTGIHPADRNILFRGLGLRMARSGFASFMIVGSYYLTVNYLVSEGPKKRGSKENKLL
jgi:hypothetical protein